MADITVRSFDETNPVEMLPGVTRRTLVSGDGQTLVRFELAEGGHVPQHTHPHEQAGTVIEGRVRFRIGDREAEVTPGDSYLIPGDMPHSAVALEASVLIEVFAPVREEFAADLFPN
ncbi:MAG: cupin domain-containing protein [Chloroflexi bacterium]|nr:cupin domain-containing protein [Chloroflexota bacterium]MQC47963.1 cupin domain-containing protein [Chloroflexota bacterium]